MSAATSWLRGKAGPTDFLPPWLGRKVPRDHWETDAAFSRRRRIVTGTAVAGASVLGLSLSTTPDSKEFYGLTLGAASVWTVGGLASGPLHLGFEHAGGDGLKRPVILPIVTGAAAFAGFYGVALVARQIPILNTAITSVLRYAHQGSNGPVLLTTLANGAAEEVFFRGALYAAVGTKHPVPLSTAGYMVATAATRNPALILASGVMGGLFALQRQASGGIQASTLTHLTWSTLMLRYLPPLFKDRSPDPAAG